LAGKSRNPYTDAILSVVSQYDYIAKDAKKKRVPKVMAERREDKHNPISRWLSQNNIEDRDFEGFL
tara:strand:+ start:1706 stop:1903 length:198 start_codon:yes stop_codon:yes gene_type:complete